VLSRLDHGNAVLAGISVHLLERLQSVINSAARLVFCHQSSTTRRHSCVNCIGRVLRGGLISHCMAVLAFKCLHGLAPSYLADELHHPAETEFIQRLLFGQLHLQLYQSPVPDCRPTATKLSRSPSLGSGTVFLSTSHMRRHSPPSAFVSRHTIIIFVIRSTFVRACEVTSSFWTR